MSERPVSVIDFIRGLSAWEQNLQTADATEDGEKRKTAREQRRDKRVSFVSDRAVFLVGAGQKF